MRQLDSIYIRIHTLQVPAVMREAFLACFFHYRLCIIPSSDLRRRHGYCKYVVDRPVRPLCRLPSLLLQRRLRSHGRPLRVDHSGLLQL